MWDDIHGVAKNSNNVFTLYIDDLTVSGQIVLKKTFWQIQQKIYKHGLSIKTKKTQWIIDQPADVTGVIIGFGNLRLPNRQHKKLAQAKSDFSKPGGHRIRKANVLSGRKAQASQILNYQQ